MILEVDPKFGGIAEEPSEPKGRGDGDAPLALDDLAYPGLGDPRLLRQAVGCKAHRPQELLQEDLAGMDIRHFAHGLHLPKSDNPRSPRGTRFRPATRNRSAIGRSRKWRTRLPGPPKAHGADFLAAPSSPQGLRPRAK